MHWTYILCQIVAVATRTGFFNKGSWYSFISSFKDRKRKVQRNEEQHCIAIVQIKLSEANNNNNNNNIPDL